MGTRPGAIDPGVILYLFQEPRALGQARSRRFSTRNRVCSASPASATTCAILLESTDPGARLAVDYFVYRAAREIGALAAVLGGIDGLVFTAGIGENSAEIRKRISEACSWLGIELDRDANLRKGPRISRAGSRVSAWVIPTNEELMIARHTGASLGAHRNPRLTGKPRRTLPFGRAARKKETNMSISLKPASEKNRSVAWRGFVPGTWQSQVNVREFIQSNYTPYEGDGAFLQGATERTRGMWATLQPLLAQEREKGILDVSQIPSGIVAHAPGYIDKEREIIVGLQTDAPLKRAIMPFGGWRVVAASLESYGYKPDPRHRRDLHQVPQDAQRRRLRRLHAGHQECAVVWHCDRPAGCIRPRPDHRRLSPGRALRRRLPHHRQAAREAGTGRPSFDRGHDPPARGAGGTDPVAQRAQGDGVELRLRHLGAGHQRPRGRAVDLLRVSRRHQAAERGGDVGRALVHVLGHLLRARPSRRHAHRVAGTGDHRRPRDQVAHRALSARPRVQPALLR